MPISKYFGGSGQKVIDNMTKEYGPVKGKQVFYATLNKRKKQKMGGLSNIGKNFNSNPSGKFHAI